MGIFGTYYFRCKPWVFKPKVMEEIRGLGHEIGYHYECLTDAHGNFPRARELMICNLTRFRNIPMSKPRQCIPPALKKDNRLIFDKYELGEFA